MFGISKKIKEKVLASGKEYFCIFEKNESHGYTVIVPELRWVITEGKNLEEAKQMIIEAIELHCECVAEENNFVPLWF